MIWTARGSSIPESRKKESCLQNKANVFKLTGFLNRSDKSVLSGDNFRISRGYNPFNLRNSETSAVLFLSILSLIVLPESSAALYVNKGIFHPVFNKG